MALVVPEQGSGGEALLAALEELEEDYELRLELQDFPSAADQRRFLRLLPETDVDGVLLWPISVNQDDYAGEMHALREAGVPLVVVSKQLGHAQTSTTANIYAHAIASAQAKAMQTFDRFNDLIGQEQGEEQSPERKKKAAGN